MATIVNNPPAQNSNDSGGNSMSLIVGIIAIIVLVILFVVYVMPMIQQGSATPQVNIPDKVDVNVNQPE